MSTSSGYAGFCKTCRHPNANHKYEACWVGNLHGNGPACRQKIKICCALSGHEGFGITGAHVGDYVICKPCKHHGRSALNSEYNKYAVIGFKDRQKAILEPRRDDTPQSASQSSNSNSTAASVPSTVARQVNKGVRHKTTPPPKVQQVSGGSASKVKGTTNKPGSSK